MLFVIPRSPRWLVKKGRLAEAGKVLLQLGDTNEQDDSAAKLSRLLMRSTQERGAKAFLPGDFAFQFCCGNLGGDVQPACGYQLNSLLP